METTITLCFLSLASHTYFTFPFFGDVPIDYFGFAPDGGYLLPHFRLLFYLNILLIIASASQISNSLYLSRSLIICLSLLAVRCHSHISSQQYHLDLPSPISCHNSTAALPIAENVTVSLGCQRTLPEPSTTSTRELTTSRIC
jgi:hypothetical protein